MTIRCRLLGHDPGPPRERWPDGRAAYLEATCRRCLAPVTVNVVPPTPATRARLARERARATAELGSSHVLAKDSTYVSDAVVDAALERLRAKQRRRVEELRRAAANRVDDVREREGLERIGGSRC